MRGQPEWTEGKGAPGETLPYKHRGGVGFFMGRPDFHSAPFVEGIESPIRGSRSQAMRSARAVA